MEENKGTLVEIDLTRELKIANKVEIILGDYEIKKEDGKTYLVKKHPNYPKTYEECCEILDIHPKRDLQPAFFLYITQYEKDLDFMLCNLQHLLICRDAYWKIVDWKPDWTDNHQKKYTICYYQGEVSLTNGPNVHVLLAFPTEEMRDAFLENFKVLIEDCKELL